MNGLPEQAVDSELQQEMMLKLITKGFYRELMNYGIAKKGVVSVSSFLLENLLKDLKSPSENNSDEYYNQVFTIKSVRGDMNGSGGLALDDVSLAPMPPGAYDKVAAWLSDPAIRNSFIPAFPGTAEELALYFSQPGREYFAIQHGGEHVGMIGADSIDEPSRKLEMKKLVGNKDLQGRGIGKIATFLFLYYAFVVKSFDKVFIHSGDTNIRNIILNSKFGFELEGIFFSDVVVGTTKRDVVRMGLLRTRWMDIFKGE